MHDLYESPGLLVHLSPETARQAAAFLTASSGCINMRSTGKQLTTG